MTPRKSTSKKWTALPGELCTQIREVFAENFAEHAKMGQIFAEGRIYSNELLLQVGYLETGRLRQVNFEVSLDFDPNKQNALTQIHLAVDCAATLFNEYFSAEEDLSEFPIIWSPIEVEKNKAFVQVSTVNTSLEAEADRILGEHDDSLVVADEDDIEIEDEKKAIVTMLGLDKDDVDILSEDADPNVSKDLENDDQDGPVNENKKKVSKKSKNKLH